MKHRLYIAILAVLVALWGCTRVEMDPVPGKKVTFSVGSYVPQTRAVSLDSEGITSFTSKAFLHAEGVSGVQNFFGPDGESIVYNPTALEWAPAIEYFWPKSSESYINFVSWYDELSAPTTATETSLVWSNRTIGANDNILVADVAWRYKENTTNAAQYTGDAILTGVPVLFHRMLSRVVGSYGSGQSFHHLFCPDPVHITEFCVQPGHLVAHQQRPRNRGDHTCLDSCQYHLFLEPGGNCRHNRNDRTRAHRDARSGSRPAQYASPAAQ